MPHKSASILLIVLVALMVTFTGTVSTGADNGHYTGLNEPAGHVPDTFQSGDHNSKLHVYSTAIGQSTTALYADVEGFIFNTQFIPRARDQLHQNKNRNDILKFIAANPGYTMSDIAKLTGMNLGTVRYHLMVLSDNHLVTEYRDGARQIRYFTNNGSYGEDQMKVISLLRREPVGRLAGALMENTDTSNSRLSAASGLSYTEVNRYLKELMAKGIVVKEPLSIRKSTYRIAPGLDELIKKYANIK